MEHRAALITWLDGRLKGLLSYSDPCDHRSIWCYLPTPLFTLHKEYIEMLHQTKQTVLLVSEAWFRAEVHQPWLTDCHLRHPPVSGHVLFDEQHVV